MAESTKDTEIAALPRQVREPEPEREILRRAAYFAGPPINDADRRRMAAGVHTAGSSPVPRLAEPLAKARLGEQVPKMLGGLEREQQDR
ncbi:hypothetical protein GCM10023205_19170 [Yinghuangia aomiensis]|uniref:Uncharacterized protein n=1 Tax=Yinghuangia aomiensis TaxID=676205 RepID=A0ABP9GYS9_9ACTN